MARKTTDLVPQKPTQPSSMSRTDEEIEETVKSVYARRDEIRLYLENLDRAQKISRELLNLEIGV